MEKKGLVVKVNSSNVGTVCVTENALKIVMPLVVSWKPKEDITAFELAQCLPILLRHNHVMPNEIDISQSYMRHFKIFDPNK